MVNQTNTRFNSTEQTVEIREHAVAKIASRAWEQIRRLFGGGEQEERNTVRTMDKQVRELILRIKRREHRRDLATTKLLDIVTNDNTERLLELGVVDSLTVNKDEAIQICDGWTSTIVYRNPHKEKLHVQCTKGKKLPLHNHVQVEQIEVIEGCVEVVLIATSDHTKSGDTVMHKRIKLYVGDECTIPPFLLHEITPIADTEMFVSFHPPLTTEDDVLNLNLKNKNCHG